MSRASKESRERREVRTALRALLPQEVGVAVWGVDPSSDDPVFEEVRAVASAVPKRRTEFLRGRACARAALAMVGAAPAPIPVGASREPSWPEGFIGTITHSGAIVAAAATGSARSVGVGIDVERRGPLSAGVRRMVLTEEEMGAADPSDPDEGILRFSAKESVHKAIFPATRVRLDFDDVILHLDRSSASFRVEPRSEAAERLPLEALVGRWGVTDGYVVTSVHWPRVERRP